VRHYNRPGFSNLLRRNYRWGYSAIESKATTAAARMAWLYRYPKALIAASAPIAVAQTIYIVGCWMVQGRLEPLLTLPWVFLARCAYCTGAAVGTLRWLGRRQSGSAGIRPAWE
jgi:hypothetical protein